MRDSNRIKEKLEFSLDNRQMVGLFVTGVVVLGIVFVLGVVVGKKLVVNGQAAPPDLLSTLDAKAAALNKVHPEEPALTFHEELTKSAPEVTHAAPVPPPAAPPTPPPAVKPEAPRAEANPAAAAPPKETKAPVPASAHKPASSEGPYTLQISATQNRGDAEKFVQGLRQKGYSPYIVEARVEGKGTWFRIRLGHFPSKEVAGKYLQDFHRETQTRAYVTAAGE